MFHIVSLYSKRVGINMKAILIDDELLALNYLEHQLLSITDVEIIGKYTDPMLGKEAIEKREADIVFLDIHIPGISGIELAEILLEGQPNLQIVFVTAFDNFAIKAFELNALDYILKPVRKERILKTINRIKQKREIKSDTNIQEFAVLEMNLLQQFSLFQGQQHIPLHWRTTKVLQLFLYLVHYRGKIVSKSELIELLWREYEPKKAYAQLYTSIYHVRKTLESLGNYFIIRNTSEGYVMTLENVLLDVERFEAFIQSSRTISNETIDVFEQEMSLYKGDYLEGYEYLWAEGERQRLRLQWVGISLKMLDWYHTTNHIEKAIILGLDICNRYPLVEEAYYSLMKICAENRKNHSSVHYHFHRLKTVLLEELNVEPSPAITEWYINWKNKTKE